MSGTPVHNHAGKTFIVDVGLERVEVEISQEPGHAWLAPIDERGKPAGVILLDRKAAGVLGRALAQFERDGTLP